jgi:hypothetical protein
MLLLLAVLSPQTTVFFTHSLNLLIRLKASVSLFVPSSSLAPAPERFDAPKLERRRARKRLRTCGGGASDGAGAEGRHEYGDSSQYYQPPLTTRFPMTTVARKKGTQTLEATCMQSHIDSIHSPHSTRKTIMKLCMKSVKFQRGIIFSGKRSTLSEKWDGVTCLLLYSGSHKIHHLTAGPVAPLHCVES